MVLSHINDFLPPFPSLWNKKQKQNKKNAYIDISEYWGTAKALIVMSLSLKCKAVIAQSLPLISCYFC